MHIGLPCYLNALPFVSSLEEQCQLTLSAPTQLISYLETDRLDVALTSSFILSNPNYERISHYCIAAEKKVDSVKLFHRIPISQLSGKKVGLIGESKTSAMLTKVLCKFHWNIEPVFEQIDRPNEDLVAFLLIGDRALSTHLPNYYSFDLCQGWYELTQLPFVFAIFAQKRKTPPIHLELYLENLSEKINDSLFALASQKSGIDLKSIKSYYQKLNYFFGERESHALNLFLELTKKC